MSLTFGIDYDDTITADPVFFRELIELIRDQDHRAVIVTTRPDEFPWTHQIAAWMRDNFGDDSLPVVFTAGMSKEKATREEHYFVDIWIDAAPENLHR